MRTTDSTVERKRTHDVSGPPCLRCGLARWMSGAWDRLAKSPQEVAARQARKKVVQKQARGAAAKATWNKAAASAMQ